MECKHFPCTVSHYTDPNDIEQGDLDQVLALLWAIICHYHLRQVCEGNALVSLKFDKLSPTRIEKLVCTLVGIIHSHSLVLLSCFCDYREITMGSDPCLSGFALQFRILKSRISPLHGTTESTCRLW